jgi:hypothetical protein
LTRRGREASHDQLVGARFDPGNFNSPLQAFIAGQNIVHTTTLSVSTENGGGSRAFRS